MLGCNQADEINQSRWLGFGNEAHVILGHVASASAGAEQGRVANAGVPQLFFGRCRTATTQSAKPTLAAIARATR